MGFLDSEYTPVVINFPFGNFIVNWITAQIQNRIPETSSTQPATVNNSIFINGKAETEGNEI